MKRNSIIIFIALLIIVIPLNIVFATDGNSVDYTVDCINVTASNLGSVSGSASFVAGRKVDYSIDVHVSYSDVWGDGTDSNAPGVMLILKDCTTNEALWHSPNLIVDNNTTKHFDGSLTISDSDISNGYINANDVYVIYIMNRYGKYPSNAPIDILRNGTIDSQWIGGGNEWQPYISGQLNSYDCLSNTAVFALSSNFNLQSVSVDGLDVVDDTSKVLSSSFDSSTANLTVTFSNTINESTTNHTLFITGTGTRPDNGTSVSAKTNITFDTSQCSETPPVEKGQFKIVMPEDGQKFDSGTTTIDVKCAYGGNIEDDYGTGATVDVGIMYQLSSVGGATITDYTIDNNVTYWTTTITLSNNPDGTYTAEAELHISNNNIAGDQISFTIGQATGNPLIDFIKRLWKEFKQWFIDTMKYLFVPTDTETTSLINDVQSLNLHNYIPVLDLSGNQTDCLTLYNGSFDLLGTQSGNIDWQICLSDVPDNIWNIIKTGTDLFIAMLLLLLIVKAIGT